MIPQGAVVSAVGSPEAKSLLSSEAVHTAVCTPYVLLSVCPGWSTFIYGRNNDKCEISRKILIIVKQM